MERGGGDRGVFARAASTAFFSWHRQGLWLPCTTPRLPPPSPSRYGQLLRSAIQLADTIPPATDASHPHCVAVMAEPGPDYVAATWAAWLRGAVSVPLCPAHADAQLQYFFEDSRANCVLASESHLERMVGVARPFAAEVLQAESRWGKGTNAGLVGDEDIGDSARAMDAEPLSPLAADPLVAGAVALPDSTPSLIIYTSGTTGKPKGAVHTHGSLGAQIEALRRAWEFTEQDRVLHVLPLHHIHGIVNGLLTTLASGGAVEMRPKFSVHDVWERLERETDPITVFHGVPTMYSFLAAAADPKGRGDADAEFEPTKKKAAHRLRFAAAGSSAAPSPLHAAWKALSGQPLLERYGMTETGMTLGNPLHGERRIGTVGVPFPFIEAKIETPDGPGKPVAGDGKADGDVVDEVNADGDAASAPGELLVRGPQLFKEYLNRPEATAEAFTPDGYFRTGDVAITSGSPPYFTLLGRASIDVIKRAGYKISALEIESALLQHPALREMAVFPLASDDAYGEDIVAVAVPRGSDQTPELDELRTFAKDKLAPYQLPTKLVYVDAIERNAMGKVNKKALRKKLFDQ